MTAPSRKLLLSAAIAAGFAAAAPVHAQTAAVEVVTVTATKRVQLLTDVPQSVQAIGEDKLRAEGVVSMSDIIQLVPGASQTFKAAPGFEVLQVRGISSGAVGDSLVGYYIDEIPFSLPNLQYIPPVNVFDLSRVEVLRGPQGTLYGQSSMGGAIRLITRKPKMNVFSGEVAVGYGRIEGGFNAAKADVALNIPVQQDTFALRLSGGTSTEDSYITNGGKSKNSNLRAKGLLTASNDLGVEFTLWRIQSRQDDFAYGQIAAPYLAVTSPAAPRGVQTDVSVGNVTLNYATSVGDLVSSTSYMDHQFVYQVNLLSLPGYLSDNNTYKTKSLSQELRMTSKAEASTGWITGLFFQDNKLDSVNHAGFPANGVVLTNSTGALTSRSLGLFGEVSQAWMNGQLVPTLGLRVYRDERSSNSTALGVPTAAARTFSSTNPRLNLAYKPAQGALLYTNIAKGFRSGTLQGKTAADTATSLGLPASVLMPDDSLWSYEVGGKWDIARSLAVELALYRIDWKDAQLTTIYRKPDGTSVTFVSGGSDIGGTGVDFGLTWATPVSGLSLQVAGNVNQTEFKRTPAASKSKVGDQIPGSPKKSGSLAVNYRGELVGLGFTANTSYNYRGSQTELATGLASDSIRDLRVRLGVGQKAWDASLYAMNLNNQKGVAAVLNSATVNAIQPRKIGLDVAYRF